MNAWINRHKVVSYGIGAWLAVIVVCLLVAATAPTESARRGALRASGAIAIFPLALAVTLAIPAAVILLWILPIIIAKRRHVANVVVIGILAIIPLGITWLVALVMSLWRSDAPQPAMYPPEAWLRPIPPMDDYTTSMPITPQND